MNKETSEVVSWGLFFILVAVCAFFISTCSVNLNELRSTEKICAQLLEAKQDGKGVCDKRPTHWSHGDSREIQDAILLPE